MAKKNENGITEITSWKQLKEKSKIGTLVIELPDGEEVALKVQSLSKKVVEDIIDKYEDMKPAEPETIIRPDKNAKPIKIKVTEGPDWDKYQKEVKAIDNLKMAELALAFLTIKPEGTFEEQVQQLNEDIGYGHFIKIINFGYQVSGFDFDTTVQQSKNS